MRVRYPETWASPIIQKILLPKTRWTDCRMVGIGLDVGLVVAVAVAVAVDGDISFFLWSGGGCIVGGWIRTGAASTISVVFMDILVVVVVLVVFWGALDSNSVVEVVVVSTVGSFSIV